MKRLIILILTVGVLGGCMRTGDILKMGPDTYSVSSYRAPIFGGASGAQSNAIKEANAHCESIGKEIIVSNTHKVYSRHKMGGTSEITFMCLDREDSELTRPKYRANPDVVIENRY